MRVSTVNEVKIYKLGRSEKLDIPEWQARLLKKKLRGDPEWENRIDLIQDFEFPEATNRLKLTQDGNYIIGTGVYKPQMRVFDLAQKSMKFERHTNAETLQFEILSTDWTKVALLQNDRTVEFHAKHGMHYRVRVPRFGRDMAYDCETCELMVGGDSNEVWRIDLEAGSFLKSYDTNLPEVNVLKVNSSHGLIAVGGKNGVCEFYHPVEKHRVASLDVAKHLKGIENSLFFDKLEITAIGFCEDSLSVAFGTSSGHVLIYDLRTSEPLLVQEHKYNLPIKFIGVHGSRNIVSADKRSIRIWDRITQKHFTTVEPVHDLNDVCLIKSYGLISCAVENSKIETFFIPALGPAPSWCSYLENFAEEAEIEEGQRKMYESYKFVTPLELERLSLTHLIGTDKLSSYMHGFFIDFKLYQKAKAIAAPFAYEEYKKRLVKERYEKLAESRINTLVKPPNINKDLAERILNKKQSSDKRSVSAPEHRDQSDGSNKPVSIINDPRFADLFVDENFEINELDPEYKLRHPSESQMKRNNLEGINGEFKSLKNDSSSDYDSDADE